MFVNSTLFVKVFFFFGYICHGAFLIDEKLSHIIFSINFLVTLYHHLTFPKQMKGVEWFKRRATSKPKIIDTDKQQQDQRDTDR